MEADFNSVESCSDAIALVSADGRILCAGGSTAALLGHDAAELRGRNGLDLVHPEDRRRSAKSLLNVAANPQWSSRFEVRIRQKDGTWGWVESTTSSFLDEPQLRAIVVTYRPVEASRRAEAERRKMIQDVIRANAELRTFAHTVAHDLREPLRTIGAFSALLVKHAQMTEADKESGRFIVDGVKRISRILDDLLASATAGIRVQSTVALDSAVRHATENLKLAIASSGAIISVGPLPSLAGTETDFIRLFQNLISNAVKFRGDSTLRILISAERSGRDWVIKVQDNGIGVAKEHCRRVFGMFQRIGDGKIAGTGIGLALCRNIVEAMGGDIWVESADDAGATFCFSLAALPDTVH